MRGYVQVHTIVEPPTDSSLVRSTVAWRGVAWRGTGRLCLSLSLGVSTGSMSASFFTRTRCNMARLSLFTVGVVVVLVALAASGAQAEEDVVNIAHPDEKHTRRLLEEFKDVLRPYDPSSQDGSSVFFSNPTNVAETKRRRLILPAGFVGLTAAISQTVKIFTKIVSFFGSTYTEQLVAAHMDNGYKKFKGSSKVFEGKGLAYNRIPLFTKYLAKSIGLENPDDIAKMTFMLKWSEYGDADLWKQNQMTFSVGKGGMCKSFTIYANNNIPEGKMNILYMVTNAEFKLAPNIFVILVSESRFGGLFTSSSVKYKKVPANIHAKDVQFVNEYFNLIAIQLVADMAGLAVPKDPEFKKGLSGTDPRPSLPGPSTPGPRPPRPSTPGPRPPRPRPSKKKGPRKKSKKHRKRRKKRLLADRPTWDLEEEYRSTMAPPPVRLGQRIRSNFLKHLLDPALANMKCWGCRKAKAWVDTNMCNQQCHRLNGLEGWCDQVCHSALSCERLRLCPLRPDVDVLMGEDDNNNDLFDDEDEGFAERRRSLFNSRRSTA